MSVGGGGGCDGWGGDCPGRNYLTFILSPAM